MDPVGKILGGTKELVAKKREYLGKKVKVLKGKFDEKSHKLHERLETKGEETEEHLHERWGHKKKLWK